MRLIDILFSPFELNDAILIQGTYQHLGFYKPRNLF